MKIEDLLIYATTQTHSLGLKAGLVLGVQVRTIDVTLEDQFALRGEALRNALKEDEGKGLHPFILSRLNNGLGMELPSLFFPSQFQLLVLLPQEPSIISRRSKT